MIMRNIFEDDAYTERYRALTNKIRQSLESIFEEYQPQGYSKKGFGMTVKHVVYAMYPEVLDDVEPLKYEEDQ